ncbi:MAG: hflX [Anaerocolumna sp.]|jgi:GTP-binding protein HflX|nr:hflX [Anaerocolumna sp.]
MEQKQKAIIAGININNNKDFDNSMIELKNLAAACDIDVVGEITQKSDRIYNSHYFGKGKVEELKVFMHEKQSDMVIFDDELSPSQIRNLEAMLDCRVIDRTVLILDIFAIRAKTKEAQLQVEMAKLQYMLPRLSGLGDSVGHQGGGEGFINRGSGETKLELDRRRILERISILQKELDGLVVKRQNLRNKRKKVEIPVIALVGYTNAGKSTIMNAMLDICHKATEKQVFEKDMLFATLDTSVRNIKLPNNKSFLLTDTVGFISKLPHQLVKAFRSTLEEALEADMLIHVVDYSNPDYKKQIDITNETLKEIGVKDIPIIYAYNKIDLAEENTKPEDDNSVYISAKKGIGLENLISVIEKKVLTHYIQCIMHIPYGREDILSYLYDNASIKSTSYEENGIIVSLECMEADYKRYQQYITN